MDRHPSIHASADRFARFGDVCPLGRRGCPPTIEAGGGRPTARIATGRRRERSGQVQSLDVEALSAYPALMLFLLLVLAVLGGVAHGSFA
jgi:hypothetical protein